MLIANSKNLITKTSLPAKIFIKQSEIKQTKTDSVTFTSNKNVVKIVVKP